MPRASTPRTTWWISPISCFSNWTTPARVRCGEDRGPARSSCQPAPRYALRDFGRRGAQAHGGRPGPQPPGQRPMRIAWCSAARIRASATPRPTCSSRRRRFQPRAWVRKTAKRFWPEHRFVVPFRARCRSQPAGLCRQACRPADEGTGRGRDTSSDITDIYPAPISKIPLRRLVRPHRRADRQAYPRRDRPCDPRGARSEGAGREGRRAERGRAALPGRRAARGRPDRGHPAHLRLQQRRNTLARPFDAFLCAQTRPQPPDEPRRRLPIGQRLYGDHVQLADQGGLLRRTGEL